MEHRQEPPGRPRFRLTWDNIVVIRRDRPALPRRTLYWDDLNARADHGSTDRLPRPDDARRSPTVSALAGAI